MVRINKGTSNTIALTLSEKCTLETPYFLFSFRNDQTQEEKLFVAQDIASTDEKTRANQFIIIEKNTIANPLIGEVTLTQPGWYKYIVYEQVSSTNLLVANTTGVVEEGKMYVEVTAETNHTYTPAESADIVYNGD